MEHSDYFIGPKRNWLPAGNQELIFGICALVLGLFGANMVIFGGFALGFAIAAILDLGLTWGYLYRSGCKGDGYTRTMLVLCIILAAGFGWSADSFVKGWLFLFCQGLAVSLLAGGLQSGLLPDGGAEPLRPRLCPEPGRQCANPLRSGRGQNRPRSPGGSWWHFSPAGP